jgi:hypothetical protein
MFFTLQFILVVSEPAISNVIQAAVRQSGFSGNGHRKQPPVPIWLI